MLTEYATGKSLWVTKPETMIKKVAEAQVLRMTFVEEFNGTYDESEEWDDKKISTPVAPAPTLNKVAPPTKALPIVQTQVEEPEPQEVVEVEVEEVDTTQDVIEEVPSMPSATLDMITTAQASKIRYIYMSQFGYSAETTEEKILAIENKYGRSLAEFTYKQANEVIALLLAKIDEREKEAEAERKAIAEAKKTKAGVKEAEEVFA